MARSTEVCLINCNAHPYDACLTHPYDARYLSQMFDPYLLYVEDIISISAAAGGSTRACVRA